MFGGFFAAFEKALHTETDAQERNVFFDQINEGVADIHFVEGAQHLAKMAYARQDDLSRALNACGVTDQFIFRADFIKGVLDRSQIACAVVEDRDHRRPLVDGN